MKAALYLRSSKDRSDVSIDAQRRQLREYAASKDFIIIKEYSDAVESGKDDDRPGFQELLKDIKNPRRGWDHVIALDTSRIARRRHVSIIFEEHECKRNGIKVIYKSLPESDPITEMLLKSILQAMDEWHSLTSRAKGLAGMAENVKQGFRAGGSAPKGYRLDTIHTGSVRDGMPVTKTKLVPNDEAMLVRSYLQQRAKGLARARAIKFIKQDWPSTTLLSIERNALTYAGHTVWNRHAEKIDGGFAGGSRYRPRSEWVIQKNTHEAFITDDEAERILGELESNKRTRVRNNDGYFLAGLLRHPNGESWHVDGDGSYRINKGRRISAKNVDKAVIAQVMSDIVSDDFTKAVLDHYKEQTKPGARDKELSKALARVAELDRQSHSLAETLTQTTAQAAILRSLEKIEEERELLQNRIDEYRAQEQSSKSIKLLKLSDVRSMLKVVADQFESADSDTIKDALTSIIESVILDDTTFKASITYKIHYVTGDKVASPRGFEPRLSP